MTTVAIDARALRAFHPLPLVAPAGSIWICADGRRVVVRPDGGVDELHLDGRPHGGAASDPTAGHRTAWRRGA